MRKQYFFRRSTAGLLAWDVERLIELSHVCPVHAVTVDAIGELDRPWSGDDEPRTWRQLIAHMRLVEDADLAYPIILEANGDVMDGRHRIAKAALLGRATIDAVRFAIDPPPDHVGRRPEDLQY